MMATAAGLTDITEFTIPLDAIDQTLSVVQRAGASGREAFVLWGGVRDQRAGRLLIRSVYQPQQRAISTEDGLLVVVEGEALHRANESFFARGELIVAQAHSHPTDAFHSDTDNVFPLMTLIGGLSIVVPFFGAGGRDDLSAWAWYRLIDVGRWEPISSETKVVIAA